MPVRSIARRRQPLTAQAAVSSFLGVFNLQHLNRSRGCRPWITVYGPCCRLPRPVLSAPAGVLQPSASIVVAAVWLPVCILFLCVTLFTCFVLRLAILRRIQLHQPLCTTTTPLVSHWPWRALIAPATDLSSGLQINRIPLCNSKVVLRPTAIRLTAHILSAADIFLHPLCPCESFATGLRIGARLPPLSLEEDEELALTFWPGKYHFSEALIYGISAAYHSPPASIVCHHRDWPLVRNVSS